MTQNTAASGGGNQGSGGTPDSGDKNAPNKEGQSPDERRPSYESYQKLLDEKKARDKEASDLKKRLDEIEANTKLAEEDKLKKNSDFEKLVAVRDKEKADLKANLDSTEKRLGNVLRRQAMLEVLEGEVPKQYWGLMNLESIAIDPSTGEPDAASVVEAAKAFQTTYPEVLKKKSGTGLPNDAAKGGSGKISYDQWLTLPYEEKLKRQKDVSGV